MTVISYPPASEHHEIARSLKGKETVVITFNGCAAACPGAIVSLEGFVGRWVVCWVTRNERMVLRDCRAGLMPLPPDHNGFWTAADGWAIKKQEVGK